MSFFGAVRPLNWDVKKIILLYSDMSCYREHIALLFFDFSPDGVIPEPVFVRRMAANGGEWKKKVPAANGRHSLYELNACTSALAVGY